MTESEAIKELHGIRPRGGIIPQKRAEAIDVAINVLEEIEQYKALGTVEELRFAKEKQIPKKPDCIEDKMWCCPVCDNNLLHKWIKYPTRLMPKSEGLPHCMSCGQAIDWSDE